MAGGPPAGLLPSLLCLFVLLALPAGGGRPLEPVLLPVGAQIMAVGAQYLCYSFEDAPRCAGDGGCSVGSLRASGDITTTTISPGATLSAVGCSGDGPMAARVVQYPLRAGTPTVIPPAGAAPPSGILITSPLALVLCYTVDGTNPSCDPWKVPHCLAGEEVTGNTARVVLPEGPCTVKAVGCALGGGSGLIQGEFIGQPPLSSPQRAADTQVSPPPDVDMESEASPPDIKKGEPETAIQPGTPAAREESEGEEGEEPPKDQAGGADPVSKTPPLPARLGPVDSGVLDGVAEPTLPSPTEPLKGECPAALVPQEEVNPAPAVPVAMVQVGLGEAGATLLTLISSASGCMCYVLDGSLPMCGAEGFTCAHGVAGYGGAVAVVLPPKHLRLSAVACTPDGPSSPLQITFAAPQHPVWTPAVSLMVVCGLSVAVHAAGWLWRRMRWRGAGATVSPASTMEEALEQVQQMQWLLEEEGDQRQEEQAQRLQQIGQFQDQCRMLSAQCTDCPESNASTSSGLWERAVQRASSAAESMPT